jgi:diacylglycerol kinase family enzyme
MPKILILTAGSGEERNAAARNLAAAVTFALSPKVWRLRGTRFVIERQRAGPIRTDGETHDTGTTVEISSRPQSLRMLVPATCRVTAPALINSSSILLWKRITFTPAP